MTEGKWIPDLRAATSVADAARTTLRVRLGIVRQYLELSMRSPQEDPEHVHQLRVGTRRAVAALDIFAACLPHAVYRDARRKLRRLRRAAGQARDWDVFLADLPARKVPRPGTDFLFGYALGQRASAQNSLLTAGAEFPAGFDKFAADVLAALAKPHPRHGPRALLDLARPLLCELLEQLRQAAGRNLDDYAHLHRVRIIGKRLRYAMEVLAVCFPPPFQHKLYPAVEEMQEILGLANDSHVAGQHLAALRAELRATRPEQWKRCRPEIEALLRHHQRRLPKERWRFLKWWQHWQESGADDEFVHLLKKACPE